MVNLVTFLPSAPQISALAKLHSPVVIHRPFKQMGGPSHLLLSATNSFQICLRLVDHTAAFKFEVFELIVDDTISLQTTWSEFGRLAGWSSISCLFRFEWLRPARAAELPSHYEPVVGERGRREAISKDATQIAVSMVGLAFRDDRSHYPLRIIVSDDDDPSTFETIDDPSKMGRILDCCEAVTLDGVETWCAELKQAKLMS